MSFRRRHRPPAGGPEPFVEGVTHRFGRRVTQKLRYLQEEPRGGHRTPLLPVRHGRGIHSNEHRNLALKKPQIHPPPQNVLPERLR